MNFTFGSDPEFMLTHMGELKSAIGILPKKETPLIQKGHRFYFDNVLAEIAIKPASNKKEAIDYLNKYPYSSYLDFIGENRAQNKILNMEAFPKYFPNKTSFIEEIFEWLSLR